MGCLRSQTDLRLSEPANVAQFIYALIAASHKTLLRRTLLGMVHQGSLAHGNRRAPSPRERSANGEKEEPARSIFAAVVPVVARRGIDAAVAVLVPAELAARLGLSEEETDVAVMESAHG